MRKVVALFAIMMTVALTACTKSPDTQNVADTGNSAGAALERSANELDATTDNLTDTTVQNIDAEADGSNGQSNMATNAAAK